ncbi:MAG TPA: hypothetical protein VNZ49_09160 [Bacteroidia bacterium]|jgi:hypothetical protein|nr:hypothetical protein [Bacteroidia bacterium]
METQTNTEISIAEVNLKNPNKVTVGFKCHPEIKLALSKEATQLNITLSEYVESLVLDQRNINNALNIKVQQYLNTIDELKHRIMFYENNLLVDLYIAHKDQVINYLNSESKTMELKILEITDVYTVLINSFKINKP